MERLVILAYKPFTGKEKQLRELMKTHWLILRSEKLVSDRKPAIMQTREGVIIEVFGWISREAIECAHSNPVVQKMWEDFERVCEYIPLSNINETQQLFAEFTPMDISMD